MLKLVPGMPELASVTVAGATGVKTSVLPSTALTRLVVAAVIRMVSLFDPETFMIACRAVPAQVTPLGQLSVPAMLIETVTVPVAPDMVIVPKSRSCTLVMVSDLTTLALAWMVVDAASAWPSGTTPARASRASFHRTG